MVVAWYACMLLILMPWHRQAIFLSRGDKLSSSDECRIRTQGPWFQNQISIRLNTHWQTLTELSRIKQKRKHNKSVSMISQHSAHSTPLPVISNHGIDFIYMQDDWVHALRQDFNSPFHCHLNVEQWLNLPKCHNIDFLKLVSLDNGYGCGWGCEVSCGGQHRLRGKTTPQGQLWWRSIWHRSNTGLSSTQYEQIPIILGVWTFWLTPFFFRSITFWRLKVKLNFLCWNCSLSSGWHIIAA